MDMSFSGVSGWWEYEGWYISPWTYILDNWRQLHVT